MDTFVHILSFLLLLAAVTALTVGISLLKRTKNYLRSFALLLLAMASWAFGYGMELAADHLSAMLWWIKVEYIGIALIPAFWLFFALEFSGCRALLTLPNQIIILVIPILTLLLVWTNAWHHWHYEKTELVMLSGIPLLSLTTGIWYNIHLLYFYLLLAAGIAVLYTTKNQSTLYQKQRTIITAAALIPWLFNMLYLTRFRPLVYLDITPLAFVLTLALIGYGLYRYRLLDLLPLARAKVMQAMQEGVVILDPFLRISDYNLSAEQHLHPRFQISVGDSLTDTDDIFQLFRRLINSPDHEAEVTIELANFQQKILAFSLTCIYHQQEVEGYLLLIKNVTKERFYVQQIANQAEELKALNLHKDKLFSILAHDLKGPVHRLNTLFEFIEEGLLSDTELTQVIKKLQRESSSTYLLLENLLYWSQGQFQGMVVNQSAIDFYEMMETVIQQEFARLQEKNLILDNKIEPVTLVYVDINMTMIVMRNLLSNAIKFSLPHGRIILSCQQEDADVLVCIQDEGIGMDEQQLSKLFGQTIASTPGTNNEKGTGLGLQLCKQLVEKNCGAIWGESTKGKGSQFFIRLPLATPSLVKTAI